MDEARGGGPNPFGIYALAGLKVPMLYGIRTPRILVPLGMEGPAVKRVCQMPATTREKACGIIMFEVKLKLFKHAF